MKIGLQTWGSDGDILPFMALSSGLAAVGHDVTLVYTSVDNKEYSTIGGNQNYKLIKAYDKFVIDKEDGLKISRMKNIMKQYTILLERYFNPAVESMYEASCALCEHNDIVIGHSMSHTLLTAAQQFDRPRVVVAYGPFHIKSKHCSPIGIDLGKYLNKLLWDLYDKSHGENLFRYANDIRSRVGLQSVKSNFEELYISKELTLIATSDVLVKRQPDWGDHIQVCGFLYQTFVTDDWEMPKDLKSFLDDGPPPVFFTFGSMTDINVEKTTKLLIEAAKLSGQRAIIYSSWDRLPNLDLIPEIYCIGKSPHDKIFPHCAAIVHHGGIGTTQATLNAGCSAIVVEHMLDQEYWGNVLYRLGVSRKPLHSRTITAKVLANEINSIVKSDKIRKKAKAIAKFMKNENGVSKAVELIEKRFYKL